MMHMVKSPFALATTSLVVFLAAPAALATPPPTGGTPPDSSGSGSSVSAPAVVLDPPVIVTGGAVVVRMRSSALLGRPLNFHGSTGAGSAGQTVDIERYDPITGRWLTTATARVGRGGTFLAQWRTNLLGHISLRAVVGDVVAAGALRHGTRPRGQVSSTTAQVTVYSPARATYFGPGFFGKRTACGQVMTPSLAGVANRALPCGTLVVVNYNNRDITVPVVDRGPYANGADWDLTSAAAQALGMNQTETIGTIVLGLGVPAPQPSGPPSSPPSSGGSSGGALAAG